MDDKTFTAAFVAQELERLNQRVKSTVMAGAMPSDAEKDSLTMDIQETLARLEKALIQVQVMVDEESAAAEDGAPAMEFKKAVAH
jgi:hypothetical protein